MMVQIEFCKCYKHPALNPDHFNYEGEEIGSMDTVISAKFKATCKLCKEIFNYEKNPNFFCVKQ